MSIIRLTVVQLALLALLSVGCKQSTETAGGSASPPATADPHAHPTEGPHHGELIELGNEEYHAELLHDSQSVTIYVLNGMADQQVPIEAEQVTINATNDGDPQQFELTASADVNDPEGKSSKFVSNNAALAKSLDGHGQHRLVLTIAGKSYRGDIAHSHDDGHAH